MRSMRRWRRATSEIGVFPPLTSPQLYLEDSYLRLGLLAHSCQPNEQRSSNGRQPTALHAAADAER